MQTDKGVTGQILRGMEAAQKFHLFNEEHDAEHVADLWFQESHEGLIMFVVFYTQACRWSRCLACNLPSLCSKQHVDYKQIFQQIYHLFKRPEVADKLDKITKVIVSNNGSVLDQKTFSTMSLMYLLVKLNRHLPNMRVLTIESRPEYVEEAELEMLARAMAEGDEHPQLELAIGMEAFDDHIRNEVFMKGLELAKLEKLVKMMNRHGFRLKVYMMQKPVPGMTNDAAIDDIHRAIEYFAQLKKQYSRVEFNLHVNPTYVATGTMLEDAFHRGEYAPPILTDVAKAVLFSEDVPVSVYIGLDDEGLAVEGGSFRRPGDEKVVDLLQRFNRLQQYDLLRRAVRMAS